MDQLLSCPKCMDTYMNKWSKFWYLGTFLTAYTVDGTKIGYSRGRDDTETQ